MNSLSVISTFLNERLDIDPARVVPDATLENLGVDSMMILELVFEFEQEMNVRISLDTATPRTVGELIAIVERMQKNLAAN